MVEQGVEGLATLPRGYEAMNLDWKAIRPLHGDKAKGFQELCVQLARTESPINAEFIPKGNPDAGVECYCVLEDGSEWGWQTKYFDTLGHSQWSQIDRSVKKALAKHPSMHRYFICVPMDRPDARIRGQKSALQRWNEHVKKWQGWSSDLGMNVEFVWWGSSELLDILVQTKHIGRVYFWFDQRGFDQGWFQDRLKEAIDAAGPRYTPEIHFDLPIAQELDAFGKTVSSFDQIKSLARDVRRELRSLSSPNASNDDSHTQFAWDDLCQSVKRILKGFAALEFASQGVVRYNCVVEKVAVAESVAEKVQGSLTTLAREYESRPSDDKEEPGYRQNPFRNWSYRIYQIQATLREVRSALDQANTLANASLMVLRGDAGTGKTHLLCDVAQRRIDTGSPTVLLMGQRFLGSEEPWSQALQHLDMRHANVEEFVGALEAASQAANSRALVMIDALNEGRGRELWPVHLSSFLARLENSEWIGVVLSVRSTYDKAVIRPNVLDRAVVVTHNGFAGLAYDATRSFFSYYELEFPSAPVLQPEYSNPLFLKAICEGLRHKKVRRIPRGFHGLTAVFSLYLDAINERLGESLDYNQKDNLVQEALRRVAEQIAKRQSRWLPREQVEEVVNELLPAREFSRSLYGGLVDEGILVENFDWRTADSAAEVVFISYDRFADQVVADYLLSTHLNHIAPEASFAEGGSLAFLCGDRRYELGDLTEAMCIQVPERTGKEFMRFVPGLLEDWNAVRAFLQSIVWRQVDAFTDDTRAFFYELRNGQDHRIEAIDTLLTVSTIPDHPLNADFLDELLRKQSMPDRDAWWSTYLHHAWNTDGPVDRLVDWASNLSADNALETSVVDLAATTLAWMLTTSNRFLRDRATKALVSLLTDRLECTTHLVARFSDVDDPYVTERVYAVAYGVAMRSHDAAEVGSLASVVYENVFASGAPPVHILLRDYARGVVERTIHLGSNIRVQEQLFRPPHNSDWPDIPSEDALKALTPYWDEEAGADHELEWSRNRIPSSVMADDFAWYVIGTNSGATNWISLRVCEDTWQSSEERLATFIPKLSGPARMAWDEFMRAKADQPFLIQVVSAEYPNGGGQLALPDEQDVRGARNRLECSRERLMALLTEDQLTELESILKAEREGAPRFDLPTIQRYVLWRAFDLGWTIERFGAFDRFSIGYSGREAAKPERIGKKYQWIAYYEILAYIADHYQYRERFEGGLQAYEGPWQESLRNVDSSCTLPATPGSTSWGPHRASWWGKTPFSDWKEGEGHGDWIVRKEEFPRVEELLSSGRTDDNSRWLNVRGHFVWRQPHPADVEPTEIDRRELWIDCMGYLVAADAADEFMDWARGVDFWGRWMPEEPDMYGLLLGEYGWSPAFNYFNGTYYAGAEWLKSERCPVALRPITSQYHVGTGSFDCSVDESYSLRLPHHELVNRLGLKWSGRGADYLDHQGQLAALDPTAHEDGPTALLLREDLLRDYLSQNDLALCWTILGEKRVLGEMSSRSIPAYYGSLRMSGAYRYTDQGPKGFIRFRHDPPHDE